MGVRISRVLLELQEKVYGKLLHLIKQSRVHFSSAGLNYYKPDRNYFIRRQRPQGCKCPMNKKASCALWVNSSIPSRQLNFREHKSKKLGAPGFYTRNFSCGATTRWENENGFNVAKLFNVHSLMWAQAILCAMLLFLNNLKGEKSSCVCLWGATWRDPSSWLIQMASHGLVEHGCILESLIKMITTHWAFLATRTRFNGVSETLYVFLLCSHPLPPDATHKTQDNNSGVTLQQGARKPPGFAESPPPSCPPKVTALLFKAASNDCQVALQSLSRTAPCLIRRMRVELAGLQLYDRYFINLQETFAYMGKSILHDHEGQISLTIYPSYTIL